MDEQSDMTYAELAAKLLRDAAGFFSSIAEQNPDLADQMRDNAEVFQRVAEMVETDPMGTPEPD